MFKMLKLNNGENKNCAPVGFTLVELMVVLAVIALLMMFLLPNMRSSFQRAESTSCKNNLHQYGIAMGRYMSDYKGYFIYPGDQAEGAVAGADSSFGGLGTYKGGVRAGAAEAGTMSGSVGHYWWTFIEEYIPAKTTVQSLDTGEQSIRICPSVLRELKAGGNYFNPKSPAFKGSRKETWYDGSENYVADFEAGYDETNKDIIFQECFTTYAINKYSGVYYANRTNISSHTIAFIDWNAKEGWGRARSAAGEAEGGIMCTNWMFNNEARGIRQDTPKGTNWWVNEVGFYHKDGTNAYANYVAMDGSVGSVSSNEITENYFKPSGP
jgi:prepilin-type N-terminal cleavage/methylation domain-containing protein